jgi:hypothetical protein
MLESTIAPTNIYQKLKIPSNVDFGLNIRDFNKTSFVICSKYGKFNYGFL